MRSTQNLPGFGGRRASNTLGVTGLPLEWLDARSWRLPSGKALAEFALQAGFLAPLLFRPEPPRPERPKTSGGLLSGTASVRPKALRKGEPR
ncbi:MAG TPA: hypothetical protein VLW25_06355 [Bryobacteraceae bacterium]|jgi:hypothetical protein|nr:hypothetical protein [Bryobacteraceae bacterium]